jgi:hypothetical protein
MTVEAPARDHARQAVVTLDDLRARRRSAWDRGLVAGLGFVCAVALTVGAWVLFARSPEPGSNMASSRLNATAVYRRTELAMSRPDFVYHQTETITGTDVGSAPHVIESWLDTSRDVVRQQFSFSGFAEIVVDGTRHSAIRSGETFESAAVATCHGASIAASALLNCPRNDSSLRVAQTVTTGHFNGRPAVVLVTTTNPVGEPVSVRSRLYLDAKTFLPIGARATSKAGGVVTNGSASTFVVQDIVRRSTFRHNFVADANMPADFFNRASVDSWAASHEPPH